MLEHFQQKCEAVLREMNVSKQTGRAVSMGNHSAHATHIAQHVSEWVPGRRSRKLKIPDIDTQPCANTRTDGHQHDVLTLEHVKACTRDHIGRACNTCITTVKALDVVEIIDKHHHA
ncbi:hypothetical protein FQZ97_995130 [compost metagenome]